MKALKFSTGLLWTNTAAVIIYSPMRKGEASDTLAPERTALCAFFAEMASYSPAEVYVEALHAQARSYGKRSFERWLGKFGQSVKWSVCLKVARMAVEQERR